MQGLEKFNSVKTQNLYISCKISPKKSKTMSNNVYHHNDAYLILGPLLHTFLFKNRINLFCLKKISVISRTA